MKSNRKGFTGIEFIILIGVIGLVTAWAAPAAGKALNSIFAGNQNQQKQIHKVSEQYPVFYKIDDKGTLKAAPVPYKRTEEELNFVREEPPETLWQKFTKLGAMAIVIIVVLSYLGLWPVITLWWNKKIKPKIEAKEKELEATKIKHVELEGEARLIVISVDAGLGTLNDSIKTSSAVAAAATDPNIKVAQLAITQILTKAKEDFRQPCRASRIRRQKILSGS